MGFPSIKTAGKKRSMAVLIHRSPFPEGMLIYPPFVRELTKIQRNNTAGRKWIRGL